MGLLAGSVDIDPSKDSNKNGVSEDDWVTVITKKRRGAKHDKIDEELLIENETNHDDLVNIEEEIVLMNGKQSGHKRMSPHESPVLGCATVTMLECKQCDSVLESEGLLKSHMQIHLEESIEYACEHCDLVFESKLDLDGHVSVS